jgi:leucyl/phenylalanyl-tRNA--protein transferase
MHFLSEKIEFPDPSEATADGLLAVGGDLSVPRLILAYNSGIFPWFEISQPLLWWSPDPRMVLFPKKFKVSRSLQKKINSECFKVSFNTAFSEVIKNCSTIKRKGQRGTWITEDMQRAYIELHKAGHAVSVEIWKDEKLAGGLYGVDLPNKKIFCGESMFSKESEASKAAFYYLVAELIKKDYRLIDCQLHTPHLQSLGAEEISREKFLAILKAQE